MQRANRDPASERKQISLYCHLFAIKRQLGCRTAAASMRSRRRGSRGDFGLLPPGTASRERTSNFIFHQIIIALHNPLRFLLHNKREKNLRERNAKRAARRPILSELIIATVPIPGPAAHQPTHRSEQEKKRKRKTLERILYAI